MNKMRERAIWHYREVAQRMPVYSPTRMAELADGVVAVEDQAGECDALFDTQMWQFTNPKLWERDCESPLLHGAGLEVLEGIGSLPRVSTIQNMVSFAKSQLSPKGDYSWHETPEFFTF